MIVYYCMVSNSKTPYITDSLINGTLTYPELYEFTYLIRVKLTKKQITALKTKGWVEYNL